MQDIQTGDYVLTSHHATGSICDPVHAFGHRDVSAVGGFYQISSAAKSRHNSKPLEVTREHWLCLRGEEDYPVPARTIQLGDRVQTDGDIAAVTAISIKTKKGLYAPLTPSGKLVVNDIVAS